MAVCAADTTATALAGDPSDHHLFDQWDTAALQRALADARLGAEHDQFELHAQHLCLFARDGEPAIWLCGRSVVRARRGYFGGRLPLHACHEPPATGAKLTEA